MISRILSVNVHVCYVSSLFDSVDYDKINGQLTISSFISTGAIVFKMYGNTFMFCLPFYMGDDFLTICCFSVGKTRAK